MKINPIRLAAAAVAAGAILAAGAGAAGAATACTANCTNGTVNVGSTIGTTGFPTSFVITGQAGATASATATPYSVYSNQPWTLTFETDPSDNVTVPGGGGAYAPNWQTTSANFPIGGTTSITHAGVTSSFPAGATDTGGGISMQIDSGAATAGGQSYSDTFSVALSATQAPGAYSAEFAYVLTG
jgi:hypothetical protein